MKQLKKHVVNKLLVLQLLQSWVTLTMVKHHCLTVSVVLKWRQVKQVVLPSTLVHITLKQTKGLLHSLIHRDTQHLPQCVHVVLKQRISWYWLLQQMTV
ncbi:Uncharacterised protein [Acinetobacter baumannii]|nr:Uncharacterised protein [Acinetobacter baumannii]